jgi:TPR repeat protein
MKRDQQSDIESLFQRADEQWEVGNLKSAFRLFLACAKAGDSGCQNNLGTFYRDGIGVKLDRDRALYWYRKAYHRGLRGAASNIGVLFRDEGDVKKALAWFERAKDGDADMAIANIYLRQNDTTKAERYLRRVCKSDCVSEASREEAKRLLNSLTAQSRRRGGRGLRQTRGTGN